MRATSKPGRLLEVTIRGADPILGFRLLRRSTLSRLHVRGLTDQSATLTLTDEPAGTAHVDACAVSFYDLPEPTVTHTPATPPTIDHAVNAGAVSWAYALAPRSRIRQRCRTPHFY